MTACTSHALLHQLKHARRRTRSRAQSHSRTQAHAGPRVHGHTHTHGRTRACGWVGAATAEALVCRPRCRPSLFIASQRLTRKGSYARGSGPVDFQLGVDS